MNLPETRTSSIAINRMMMPLSIFLAIGAGVFQSLVAVEATNAKTVNNLLDNKFAFGRPISPARRKRLPDSQLKGGLLTIEELEEEFEAVRLVAHIIPKFMFFVLDHTLTISRSFSSLISALATYSSIESFKSLRCLIPCRTCTILACRSRMRLLRLTALPRSRRPMKAALSSWMMPPGP